MQTDPRNFVTLAVYGFDIGYCEHEHGRDVVLYVPCAVSRADGFRIPIDPDDAELVGKLLVAHADAIKGREPRNWEN